VLQRLPRQKKQWQLSGPLCAKLDDYQLRAVRFSLRVGTAALFFEPGTGKTWITGGLIEALLDETFQALIVVPLANIETTWQDLLNRELPQINVCRNLATFKSAPLPRILLLHYEATAAPVQKLKRIRWSLIVYDEAQKLKQRTTLQSRTAAKLRDCADRKLILTGTPIEHQPLDVWAQFKFLKPEVFGTRWADFEDEFLQPMEGFEEKQKQLGRMRKGTMRWHRLMREVLILKRKRKFNFDLLPAFIERIRPWTMYVTKDVLNLPGLTIETVPCVLRGEQRAIYDSLLTDLVASFGGSIVSAPLRVTQIIKLQQVCGGYVLDDEGVAHEAGRAKLRQLKRLVRINPKPIVVICRYLEEIHAIADELVEQYRVAVLVGRNRKQRSQIVRDFQAGKLDILICQQRTGGLGIDLFAASVALFYSINYSWIDFRQAIDRLHRRGQEKPVKIFLLTCVATIDEAIFDAISLKRKVTTHVLAFLKGET
jgi:SNF2 family DNA or RNA helicase